MSRGNGERGKRRGSEIQEKISSKAVQTGAGLSISGCHLQLHCKAESNTHPFSYHPSHISKQGYMTSKTKALPDGRMLGEGTLALRQSLIKTSQDADRMPVCMPYRIVIGEIILFHMQLHVRAVILMNSGQCGFREVICTNRSLIHHIEWLRGFVLHSQCH